MGPEIDTTASGYGIESHAKHRDTPHRKPARYLMVIDSAGSNSVLMAWRRVIGACLTGALPGKFHWPSSWREATG